MKSTTAMLRAMLHKKSESLLRMRIEGWRARVGAQYPRGLALSAIDPANRHPLASIALDDVVNEDEREAFVSAFSERQASCLARFTLRARAQEERIAFLEDMMDVLSRHPS